MGKPRVKKAVPTNPKEKAKHSPTERKVHPPKAQTPSTVSPSDSPPVTEETIVNLKDEAIYRGAFKEEKKLQFLVYYARHRAIGQACRSAKITRKNFYDWLQADTVFNEAVEACRVEILEELEGEAYKRALKDSDTLLMFLLKANSQRYRRLDHPDDKPPSDPKDVETKANIATLMNYKVDKNGKTLMEVVRDAHRAHAIPSAGKLEE